MQRRPRRSVRLFLLRSVRGIKKANATVPFHKVYKSVYNIPAVFLASVIKGCFCKLACRKRRNGTVYILSCFISVKTFIRRVYRKPFGEKLCCFSSFNIFLYNFTGLINISNASVYIVCIGKRKTVFSRLSAPL